MKANKKHFLLGEYLARQSRQVPNQVSDPGLEYLFHTQSNPGRASDLFSDLDLPPSLLQLDSIKLYRFYIGPAVSGTLPHVHTHAVNALVRGRKRWAVYVGRNKTEHEAMVKESYDKYGSGSQARDWFLTECPRLRSSKTRLWEFTQIAGDVVFIPAFYLHAVINLEPVMGFTAEFGSSLRKGMT